MAPTRGQQGLEAEPLHGYKHGLDVAVRPEGKDFEEFADGMKFLAAQDGADGEDLLIR